MRLSVPGAFRGPCRNENSNRPSRREAVKNRPRPWWYHVGNPQPKSKVHQIRKHGPKQAAFAPFYAPRVVLALDGMAGRTIVSN